MRPTCFVISPFVSAIDVNRTKLIRYTLNSKSDPIFSFSPRLLHRFSVRPHSHPRRLTSRCYVVRERVHTIICLCVGVWGAFVTIAQYAENMERCFPTRKDLEQPSVGYDKQKPNVRFYRSIDVIYIDIDIDMDIDIHIQITNLINVYIHLS